MIGIISDVHGNYPALKAVIQELEAFNCDHIISLGDVAGYYCMINECIDLLKQKKIINILGNHDFYLINNQRCPRSTTANIRLDFQRNIITDQNLKWLSESVTDINTSLIWAVHGGWNNKLDEYIDKFEFDVDSNHSIYLSGHTHIQKKLKLENRIYCNPGSVGQPRDGIEKAAYAIVSGNDVLMKRCSYDVDLIVKAMRENHFQERVSSCLYLGRKIGDDQ